MMEVVSKEHYQAAQQLRSTMAVYREAADLINIGAYVAGSNPQIDRAIQKIEGINQFLCQDVFEINTFDETKQALLTL
jgi:flagellum-specific ATP synthase